jgi:hypothetical protein
MKNPELLLIPGAGSIVLGLPYIISFFGPTEAEVRFWGFVSLCVGVVSITLAAGIGDKPTLATRIILCLSYCIIVLLQVLPTALWWQFHGRGIADGTPSSAFVAHWCFSVPHLALLVIGVVSARMTLFRRKLSDLRADLRDGHDRGAVP